MSISSKNYIYLVNRNAFIKCFEVLKANIFGFMHGKRQNSNKLVPWMAENYKFSWASKLRH